MRHMVAQVRMNGAEGMAHPQRDRSQVAALLRAGYPVAAVASYCGASRREVRRIAKRYGLEVSE